VATLRLAALLAILLSAAPARAEAVDRWTAQIAEASARFGVPADWIRRVIRAESGGRTRLAGRPITSRAGAMGLMQLMPGTWRAMRSAHKLGPDPYDPRDNILAGTAYLRAMYDRFGYPGLFAAYNAGPARYARHLATGRPLPPETSAYVAALAGAAPGPPAEFAETVAEPPAAAPPAARQDSLFFELAGAAAGAPEPDAPDSAASDLLFVTLSTASPVRE
jgi:soluble lytic murein transglycosylase-like protein